VTETAALPPLKLPELLAPAGDWDCVRAAVENGADSIYFGLDRFNARMRAQNFTEADLPALMEFLHRRGVRGYVTFNTLVFTDELADAEDYLRSVISAGVDAGLSLHASAALACWPPRAAERDRALAGGVGATAGCSGGGASVGAKVTAGCRMS
jgi:hypothetical protein